VLCAVLYLAAGGRLAASEAGEGFKVIVNAGQSGTTVRRDVLTDIYLGKAQRWGDGSRIVAVDLSATSPVREEFSQQVLGMPLDAVKVHWIRNVSERRQLPPPSKSSDEDVIAFVATEPGGLGYVSAAAAIPDTVRVVEVR
jgi:ABC-type phosphate transport system substrate-binding protein